MTVRACEEAAGADNVLHLQPNSGTDLAHFNAILTHVADQGWVDTDFIAASTIQTAVAVPQGETHPAALGSFAAALEAIRIPTAEAAAITGVPEADII